MRWNLHTVGIENDGGGANMKRLLGFLAFLFIAGPALALDMEVNAHAFEQVTVTTSTAVGVTTGTFVSRSFFGPRGGGTVVLFCTVETDDIRFRVDGTDPTRTVGHQVQNDTSVTIEGYDNVRNFKMIGSGSASATAFCTFEKSTQK